MARYANSEMTVLCEQIALVNVGGKIVKTFARFGGERCMTLEGRFYVPKSIPDCRVPEYAYSKALPLPNDLRGLATGGAK